MSSWDTGAQANQASPKFWKPGTQGPGAVSKTERSETSEGSGHAVKHNPYRGLSIDQQRLKLPVFNYRNHILYLVEKYQTVVIVGETGSGKSTQIPQYLIEAGFAGVNQCVAVTQPRRVAAITVATRVAEERGSVLGQEVGYSIRFDDCTDEIATKIKFLTDGMLVREMMKDPLLQNYSVIMLDEVHERTLYTDIIIGLLKKIQKKRPELKLIVASATMDADLYKQYYNSNKTSDRGKDTAAIMSVEGRVFPVDVHYVTEPVADYIKGTVDTVISIHRYEPPGDVLVFLTGQDEVESACQLLREYSNSLNKHHFDKLSVLPLYGSLPPSEQLSVFKRTGNNLRKVVVATNIAEASITIPGIAHVVDCGFVKLKAYNHKTGLDSLVIVPVSQASADQRSGRSGRMRSGKAYRLYTENDFNDLQANTIPEMQRSNMAFPILQLKALGIDNVARFDFISSPPYQNMMRALELLYALGALDDSGKLTDPLGLQMAEFPLDAMFAKMLLTSGDYNCSVEMLAIAAMMQIQNLYVLPPGKMKIEALRAHRQFAVEEGDHLTALNVFRGFKNHKQSSRWCHSNFLNYKSLTRAAEIHDQLKKMLVRFKIPLVSCGGDESTVLRCIVSGFFCNAARLHYTGEYRTVYNNHVLHIHPQSVLYNQKQPQWLVFGETVQTYKEYMRDVSAIEPSWLHELAPHYYNYGTERQIAEKSMRMDEDLHFFNPDS